ncbi:hypothetical protein LWI29_011926 [Acer saccharum]|uniref:Uncharacterized protein n=1 Tax=Acer saccharum TaxID=4024 RepID=A0AA39RW88_ACESA|nr:hypothetical protein LWI29_011926 [Acer saccharum]
MKGIRRCLFVFVPSNHHEWSHSTHSFNSSSFTFSFSIATTDGVIVFELQLSHQSQCASTPPKPPFSYSSSPPHFASSQTPCLPSSRDQTASPISIVLAFVVSGRCACGGILSPPEEAPSQETFVAETQFEVAGKVQMVKVKKSRRRGMESNTKTPPMKTRGSKKVTWNLGNEIAKVIKKRVAIGIDFKSKNSRI